MPGHTTRVLDIDVWAGEVYLCTAQVSDRSQIVSVDMEVWVDGGAQVIQGTSRFDLGKVWFIDQPFEGVDVNRDEVRRTIYEAVQCGLRPSQNSVQVEEHTSLLRTTLFWLSLIENRSLLQYSDERSHLRSTILEVEARLRVLDGETDGGAPTQRRRR